MPTTKRKKKDYGVAILTTPRVERFMTSVGLFKVSALPRPTRDLYARQTLANVSAWYVAGVFSRLTTIVRLSTSRPAKF